MASFERIDGPTPNGGTHVLRFFRDEEGDLTDRSAAAYREDVEYDADGSEIATTRSTLIRATWNRRFPGFQILAFADRSYLIDIGSNHKPPLVVIGWYRWLPDSIEFKRWGWQRWPDDR